LNGNLLTDSNRNFAFDDENQLIAVWVTDVWKSTFAYDGLMRRRIRNEYTWSSGAWVLTNQVNYVYDGNLVIQERNANNFPAVTYTRGDDLSHSRQGAGGIGGLLARTDNGQMMAGIGYAAHAYYFSDANGNVRALVNANGALVAQYSYDPFGNILAMSGPLAAANPYRFSSKEWHPNSGTYYYGRRFYEPNFQRWINRDPAGEDRGLNLYSIVGNKPVDMYDPLGLDAGAACAALARGLKLGGVSEALGGGPEDPAADLVAGAILAAFTAYAGYELFISPATQSGSGGMGRGNPGERKQQRESPNPDKTAGKPDN
jgi:RHS repeat-associated protein